MGKTYTSTEALRCRYPRWNGKPRSRGWIAARLKDPSFPRPAARIANRLYWDDEDLNRYDAEQRTALTKQFGERKFHERPRPAAPGTPEKETDNADSQ